MTKYLVKISSIIIYGIPFLILSGPFFSDLAIVIICIFFLIISFKEKLFHLYKNKYFQIFFCFYIYLLARSLFTQDLVSIKSSLFYIRFGLFALAFYYLLLNNYIDLKKLFFVLLFSLFTVFIDSLIQFYTGFNILGYEILHPSRISSFFYDELILGSFSFRVLILTIPLYFIYYKKKIYSFILLIIITTLILLSGERSALALIIIFAVYYLFITTDKIKYFLINILILLSLLIILLSTSESAYKRIISVTKENFYINKEQKIIAFSRVHHQHYSTGYKMFKKNILFGVGPKMFRFKCSDTDYNSGQFSCSTHPHNILIQFLAELGLVGFMFLCYFYYLLIKNLLNFNNYKNKDKERSFLILSLIVILNFFPFLPYGNFLNNWLSIFNIFSISLLGYFKNGRLKFS